MAATSALAILVLGASAADAEAARYAASRSPSWQVGGLDARLSQACRRLEFNQIKEERLFIGFVGRHGRATTGIAQVGWNLRDPKGLARPGLTYHFLHDGQSTCTVFVAGPSPAARLRNGR